MASIKARLVDTVALNSWWCVDNDDGVMAIPVAFWQSVDHFLVPPSIYWGPRSILRELVYQKMPL